MAPQVALSRVPSQVLRQDQHRSALIRQESKSKMFADLKGDSRSNLETLINKPPARITQEPPRILLSNVNMNVLAQSHQESEAATTM